MAHQIPHLPPHGLSSHPVEISIIRQSRTLQHSISSSSTPGFNPLAPRGHYSISFDSSNHDGESLYLGHGGMCLIARRPSQRLLQNRTLTFQAQTAYSRACLPIAVSSFHLELERTSLSGDILPYYERIKNRTQERLLVWLPIYSLPPLHTRRDYSKYATAKAGPGNREPGTGPADPFGDRKILGGNQKDPSGFRWPSSQSRG